MSVDGLDRVPYCSRYVATSLSHNKNIANILTLAMLPSRWQGQRHDQRDLDVDESTKGGS